ncbi:MAG: hypothetical protein KBG82_00770 [Spirochaetes bacterium]|nr:hypothetical protein [Spirochaetota bacterium]NLJ04704.1 hypothetical protein [Exilispira sp.]HPB47789.1 hypothetical protein [Exilispira sp.]HPO60881.1 hypothetical protein [Exilispira sp.]HQQ18839.1 hypothetical protein [Exilispira sp.]
MFRQILGIILLILGVLLLLSYMYNWKIELWPYSILVLGIFFFIMAGKTNPDLYIPATMLILSSLFFIYNIFTNWQNHNKLWPSYILMVSISFFVATFLGKQKSFLAGAFILLIVSLCLFFVAFKVLTFWPVLLIILGLWIILDKNIFKQAT